MEKKRVFILREFEGWIKDRWISQPSLVVIADDFCQARRLVVETLRGAYYGKIREVGLGASRAIPLDRRSQNCTPRIISDGDVAELKAALIDVMLSP